MAGPAALIAAPEGWRAHDFWHNFELELQARRLGLAMACVCLALLVITRALLASGALAGALERPRVRAAVSLLVLYAILFLSKPALLAADAEMLYGMAHLGSTVALAWAFIGLCGMLTFDVVGRRFRVPTILRDLTIAVAALVTLVLLLSRSGVNLLSIITTSAVLTAVIGLALQDTLGNLMAGISIQVESSIGIGDWIRVDDRAIGQVREIRWRSTLIQTKNGDLVTIPNGLFARGIITNFNKDGLENRRWVYFRVHMRHPPNVVQAAVVAALDGTPNVSRSPAAECIVVDFEESGIRYAVRYRLLDFLPDDGTDSEVRKRIWYALKRHDLEMPYPARNVFVTELNAERAQHKQELDRARREAALGRVGFFAPLSEAERQRVIDGMRRVIFGAGEPILRIGEPGDSLYLIVVGRVSVRLGVNGSEREVATLGEGQFFGEMSLMTGEPRRATVVAATDAECYVIDRALFQQVLHANVSLAESIGHLLAERESANRLERAELSAEAARPAADHQALLERIKGFFGLA